PLVGYSFAHDLAGRSDTPFSVYSLPLSRHAYTVAGTLVLDRTTELDLIDDLIFESGDQTKPYRYLPIFTAQNAKRVSEGAWPEGVNARRLRGRVSARTPLSRKRLALTARLAWRGRSSTLIVSERGYLDDWGLRASTSNLRWVNDPSERISLWP